MEIGNSCFILAVALSLSIYTTVVSASDVMDDKRLFFTPQQRELLDFPVTESAQEDISPSKSSNEQSQRKAGKIRYEKFPGVAESLPVRYSFLVFNGVILGRNSVHVLINGLPCQPVLVIDFSNVESSRPVYCRHLEELPLSLGFHLLSRQVIVQLNELTKARLSPGESL